MTYYCCKCADAIKEEHLFLNNEEGEMAEPYHRRCAMELNLPGAEWGPSIIQETIKSRGFSFFKQAEADRKTFSEVIERYQRQVAEQLNLDLKMIYGEKAPRLVVNPPPRHTKESAETGLNIAAMRAMEQGKKVVRASYGPSPSLIILDDPIKNWENPDPEKQKRILEWSNKLPKDKVTILSSEMKDDGISKFIREEMTKKENDYRKQLELPLMHEMTDEENRELSEQVKKAVRRYGVPVIECGPEVFEDKEKLAKIKAFLKKFDPFCQGVPVAETKEAATDIEWRELVGIWDISGRIASCKLHPELKPIGRAYGSCKAGQCIRIYTSGMPLRRSRQELRDTHTGNVDLCLACNMEILPIDKYDHKCMAHYSCAEPETYGKCVVCDEYLPEPPWGRVKGLPGERTAAHVTCARHENAVRMHTELAERIKNGEDPETALATVQNIYSDNPILGTVKKAGLAEDGSWQAEIELNDVGAEVVTELDPVGYAYSKRMPMSLPPTRDRIEGEIAYSEKQICPEMPPLFGDSYSVNKETKEEPARKVVETEDGPMPAGVGVLERLTDEMRKIGKVLKKNVKLPEGATCLDEAGPGIEHIPSLFKTKVEHVPLQDQSGEEFEMSAEELRKWHEENK